MPNKFMPVPALKILPHSPGPTRHDRAVVGEEVRRWLSLGSLKKYDAPLSELDPLAMKPKRDEKV